jgi:hypothetical protein
MTIYNIQEEFEHTKGIAIIRKLKKDRQHNGQKKKDKQWSTKSTHKTKDRVTWTPLKTGGELRCSGRISSSSFTSGTRCVNLVTNLVISHEWGNTGKCLWQMEHIRGHLWPQIFHSGQPCHGGDRKTFEVIHTLYIAVNLPTI